MIRKMNSSDFEKVYKLVCDLEETCFDLDKVAEVIEFCVDTKHRSQHIGAKLFEYAKTYAKDNGCVVLDLTTNQKRHRAHKFYENHGMDQTHYKYTLNLID